MQKTMFFCIGCCLSLPLRSNNLKFIMKVSTCFFLLIVVTAHLLVASPAKGQENVDTKIDLDFRNVKLRNIFKAIELKADIVIMFEVTQSPVNQKVSISVKQMPVRDVLDFLLAKRELTWDLVRNNVVRIQKVTDTAEKVLQHTNTLLEFSLPPFTIRGKILNEKQEPVIASVTIKGSGRGTTSDANGDFELKEVEEEDVLVITAINIQTQELKIADYAQYKTGIVPVSVKTLATSLGEVVLVGYGTQKKTNLTGAVAQVSGRVLENRGITNIGQGLQGVIGNLYITTTADPGGVGTPASFNVRGVTSLNGGGPLFVVDGVPAASIDNLNPYDIENITVLKDAASAAIYGARASYGVVLIATKKGSRSENIAVNYGSMLTWSAPTVLPRMASSVELAETYNEAAKNSGLPAPFSDEHIERFKKYIANPASIPVTTPNPNDPNYWGYDNANANVDWFKEYVKPWALNQKHDISISGGTKNTTYYTSLGFLDQNGLLRYGNDNFKRYNVSSNVHTEPVSWMKLDFRMRFAKSITDNPFPYANLTGNWFHLAGTRLPFWPVRNPDGYLSNISAIPFFNSGGRSVIDGQDLWLTGAVELEPIKDWKINLDYSWNQYNSKASNHDAFVYAYAVDGSKYIIGNGQNSISESVSANAYSSFNVYSSYEKQVQKHYARILVGQQLEVSRFFTLSGTRRDLITDAIPSMGVATGTQLTSDAISHWATTGSFVRFNYNFDERYLLEFNGRYDGTSKFPSHKRFGFFPSLSVGYNIAKEKFWPLKETVKLFKIRASYGSLGNQAVANYLYLSTVPVNSNLAYLINNQRPNYLSAPGLVSSDLTWETVRTKNVGIDIGLLNNRLDVSFDMYRRETLDMLGPAQALPVVLGTSVPVMNNANLVTRGFELGIAWKDKIGKNLSYQASLVLSDYLGKVTKYNNPTNILSTYYEGHTIGEIWGWRSKGLIQTDEQLNTMPDQSFLYGGNWYKGDVLYEDINKDGKVDYGDYTLNNSGDYKIIGNNTPRYAVGINAGLNWKGFDFNMFWQGIGKRDAWLTGTIFYGLLGEYGSAVWKNTMDYWTPENTDAYWPRPYNSGEILKNRAVTDRYMQNAAYIRLKNLQLGYSVPVSLLNKIKLKQIRIFATGENLLTFTRINKSFDPEAIGGRYGSGKIYPLMKTFTLGINVGL